MIDSVERFLQVDKNAGLKCVRTVVDIVHEIHDAMYGIRLCSEPELSFAQDEFVKEFVNLVIYYLL